MRKTLFTFTRQLLPLLVIAVPIMVVAVLASRVEHLPQVRSFIASMQSAGGEWWAVPLFFVAYGLFALFLLPVGLLSALAALVWGWRIGGFIELVACTLSALPPFLLARGGLAQWVERRIRREDVPALDSPFILLLLRIVPLVPYVALNYIAGSATRIRVRDFVVMTFAGSIPSVFLFAWFVDTMAAGAVGAAEQAKIFAVCGIIAAVAILLRLAADRLARRA
ncbi:MAG: VTT domain-containing protein [Acidobacteriota bacterium]|nr:VTT domain-containing protein [Acidobacteriota bacterium]